MDTPAADLWPSPVSGLLRILIASMGTVAFSLCLGEGSRFDLLQLGAGVVFVAFAGIAITWCWRAPTLWGWAFAILIGVPLGLALSPVLREAFGFGRPSVLQAEFWLLRGMITSIFIFGVILAFLTQRWSMQPPACSSRKIILCLFLFCFLALLATLTSIWSSAADIHQWSSFTSNAARSAGRLPYSDAGAWYVGSQLLESGIPVDWVARRPAHVLLRLGEFWSSGSSYQLSLILQAFLCACGISAYSFAIWRVFSPSAGLLSAAGSVTLMQPFVGTYLSGCAGFTMACIAVSFLLLGCHVASYRWRLLGSIAIGLSWLLRPGPIGVLAIPIVLEWVLKGRRRFLRGVVAGVFLFGTLMLGRGMFAIIAAPGAAQNANAAVVIYGISHGLDWKAGEDRFFAEDPSREDFSSSETASLQRELAWEQFREQPGVAFAVLEDNLYGATKFLLKLPSVMWFERYLIPTFWVERVVGDENMWANPHSAFADPRALSRPLGWSPMLFDRYIIPEFWVELIFVVILFLSLVRAPRVLKNRSPVTWLLFGGVVAFLVSMPVIWGDGRERGALIVLPFLIPWILLFVASPRERSEARAEETNWFNISPGVVGLLGTSLMILVGISIFILHRGEGIEKPIRVHVGWEPSVFVVESPQSAPVFGAGQVTKDEFVAACSGNDPLMKEIANVVANIEPPALLVQTMEVKPTSWTLVRGAGPRSGTIVITESHEIGHERLLEATSWYWLDGENANDQDRGRDG